MADLHAALAARIDEEERLHSAVLAHHPLPWEDSEDGLIWSAKDAPGDPVGGSSDPDVVRLILAAAENGLRGLAEDRDILRRHRPSAEPVPTPLGDCTVCVYCSDLDGVEVRVVGWPCWDAISLARRHGVEVPA